MIEIYLWYEPRVNMLIDHAGSSLIGAFLRNLAALTDSYNCSCEILVSNRIRTEYNELESQA